MAAPLSRPHSSEPRSERDFEGLVANLFRQHGWRMKREPIVAGKRANLWVVRGDQRYIVEVKTASEGRPDRLVPLLSQAILQARAYAPGVGRASGAACHCRCPGDFAKCRQ